MHYRADPPDALRILPLDSLTVIYHRRSGQTHVVAEPVPELLAVLVRGKADRAELIARLCLPDDPDTGLLLDARLDELVATGLIARQ